MSFLYFQDSDEHLLGRGKFLKALNNNTATSKLPSYEKWSRDSRSLPPFSPSQLSRDESLEELNARNYNISNFPSLFQKLDNTQTFRPESLKTNLTEVCKFNPFIPNELFYF